MFPLGALIAGDPAGAYQQSRQRQQQVDLGNYAAQGQQVAGEALQSMIPGMTPMPSSSPGMNPLQMLAQRFRALGAPQQPPMQMGAPAPSGGAPPMPSGLLSPMGGPPGGAAPGAGAPPASPGMGQSAAGPRLTLQQAIEAVGRNPQARGDPRVFFSAISQMTPLIRMEDQMATKEMMLAMREHIVNLQQAGMLARTGMQQEGATARTGMQQEGATARTGMQQEGASARTDKRLGAPSKNPTTMLLNKFFEEHPDATAEDAANFLKTAKPQTAGQTAAAAKTEAARNKTDELISQIDTAIGSIDESTTGGTPVTGFSGAIGRGTEFVGGVTGLGGEKTPASDFQTQIRLIQTQLPRVLAGTTRISAQERAQLDQIVRGLGTFTSPQEAKNALQIVKKVLQGSSGKGDKGAPSAASRPRATNPETGESVEWDGKQWNPVK